MVLSRLNIGLQCLLNPKSFLWGSDKFEQLYHAAPLRTTPITEAASQALRTLPLSSHIIQSTLPPGVLVRVCN